jgi:hypothetical protein
MALIPAILSFAASIVVALLTAWLTSKFTARRDRESDWRKLRLDIYREWMTALSGIGIGRDTYEAHLHFADASNSMWLVASTPVLAALSSYLVLRNGDIHQSADEAMRCRRILAIDLHGNTSERRP